MRLRHFLYILTVLQYAAISVLYYSIHRKKNSDQQQDPDKPEGRAETELHGVQSCTHRQQNIVFIKVHKCASSSVGNAILRWGLKYGANIGLPRRPDGHLGWPRKFRASDVENMEERWGRHVNILANHLVYSRSSLHAYMPRDTKYIAIVRRPYEQFVSTMNYFFELQQLAMGAPAYNVETFLSNPEKYEKKLLFKFNNNVLGWKSVTRNFMSTDLGMPDHYTTNSTLIDSYIRHLDKHIDLIMISEYFTVSMVMMRRLLCWSLGDVVTLEINTSEVSQRMLNESRLRGVHENWSGADYRMYQHFNRTFWRKVDQAGREGVLAESKQLTLLNRLFRKYCGGGFASRVRSDRPDMFVLPASEWNGPLILTPDTCYLAKQTPTNLVHIIRQRMIPRARLDAKPNDKAMSRQRAAGASNDISDGGEVMDDTDYQDNVTDHDGTIDNNIL